MQIINVTYRDHRKLLNGQCYGLIWYILNSYSFFYVQGEFLHFLSVLLSYFNSKDHLCIIMTTLANSDNCFQNLLQNFERAFRKPPVTSKLFRYAIYDVVSYMDFEGGLELTFIILGCLLQTAIVI
jgi:hypothetical protein